LFALEDPMNQHTDVRLSLPSKGRLAQAAQDFLAACGLGVDKPNPRQYAARIPALPALTVLFQRPGDIVVSVRDGSVDFGITGMDIVAERRGDNGAVLVLHDALNRDGNPNWYAVHIIVHRDTLIQAITELRAIGGSGVVVTPVTYIFEEEPARYRAMMEALQGSEHPGE
jgi:ATP phosphoribosyltransferase